MKKLLFLLAFISSLCFVSCSNDTETKNNELETILLIPSKNGTAVESLKRAIPKSTASIFPYFFYTTEECSVPTSDIENNSILYFNATDTTEEELNLLFGTNSSESSNRAAETSEESSDESITNLYIVGDLSLTGRYSNSLEDDEKSLMYKEMTKNSDGTFSYEFTYDNAMKAWGNGNGNASFKFRTTNDSDETKGIYYGQTYVFESGTYYSAKPHTTETYDKNNLLTALKQGNTYKLVVSKITKEYLIFHLEGELSETPTLLVGPFIRGVPTAKDNDWQYVKLTETEEGGYYYDFTYSTDMEDKTSSLSIVFSIMPTNAYSLGSYGGTALSGGGELSSTIASFTTSENTSTCNSVKTVYSTLENHNIILENLEDCYKYRINVSKPSAPKIEDNVYTLTFARLEKDENATPGISFTGLNFWQCRGTFNNWGYDGSDSLLIPTVSGKYTFTFTATSEKESFKIAYQDWKRQFTGVELSASNATAQTMTASGDNSTISDLSIGTKYTLTFTCSEPEKINNSGTVTVKIAAAETTNE